MRIIKLAQGNEAQPDLPYSSPLKSPKPIPDKAREQISKWCEQLGCRQTGIKLIDMILSRKVGLSSADLPDTATFANGLDAMEESLQEGDYRGAIEIAKDTVSEMLEDEGFGMLGD